VSWDVIVASTRHSTGHLRSMKARILGDVQHLPVEQRIELAEAI
jgi:hypothetical protein